MYRIALNVALSFRRQRRVRERHAASEGGELVDVLSGPEPDPARDEEIELLYGAIARFPKLDRALLLLHLDGHDHTAIGDVLGISATNVGTKIHRLKERLRANLRVGATE